MSHNTMWDGVRQRGDGGHAGLRAGVDVTGQPVAGGGGGGGGAGGKTEGVQGAAPAPRRPAVASRRDS